MSTTLLNSALFWVNYLLVIASALMTAAIIYCIYEEYTKWKAKRQAQKQQTTSETTD